MPPSQPVAGGLFRTTSTSPKVASSGSRSTALYPSRFLTISSALSNRLRNCLSGSAPFGSFVPRTPPRGLTPSCPLLARASSKLLPQTITTPRSFPSSGSTKDNHQKPGSAFSTFRRRGLIVTTAPNLAKSRTICGQRKNRSCSKFVWKGKTR